MIHADILNLIFVVPLLALEGAELTPWGWPSRGGAVLYWLYIPPVGRRSPLLRTRGYVILRGNWGGSVGSAFDSGPMCCRFESHLRNWTFRLSPQCSATGKSKALVCPASIICVTGHIKDPVPLIGKRRGLSPGGRFPPSFIHLVIITGLNKLYNCMFSAWRWP